MNPDDQGELFFVVIVGGGTGSGVFVYSGTPGVGNLVGWISNATTDPFGNEVDPIIGTQNNATGAESFMTGNANLHFGAPQFTFETVIGAQQEGSGSTPYTAPNSTWVSPAQAGSSGQMQWTLLGGDKETAKGPFGMLGPVTIGGIAGQYYANQRCYYSPGTTTVDDGAAINALIGLGITKFLIGPGTMNIVTAINLSVNGIEIEGSGIGNPVLGIAGTTFKLAAQSSKFINVIANSGNTTNHHLHGFAVDGSSGGTGGSNQPAGAWQAGIVLNNTAGTSDSQHTVHDIHVANMTGDGIVIPGTGRSQIYSCETDLCNGFGYVINNDNEVTGCDAGHSGIDGFLLMGGSGDLSNCKAWFSGNTLVSTGGVIGSRGVGASLLTVNAPSGAGAPAWDGAGVAGLTFSVAGGWGSGFHWVNISGASRAAGGGIMNATGLYAQDNACNGFKNEGAADVNLIGAIADSNGNNGTSSGTIANVQVAGFDWAANLCHVRGVSLDRGRNTSHQYAALNLGSHSRCTFDLKFSGTINDGSNLAPLLTGSNQPNISVCNMRSTGPGAYSATAFVSPWTPDPFDGDFQEMTSVTAALTINAPALAGTNTTGIFLFQGMRITIILRQDGTGHAVSLNATYKTGSNGFGTAPNDVTAITFLYDGTNWVALGSEKQVFTASKPADPVNTASLTEVMMGLGLAGWSITPLSSGKVLLTAVGEVTTLTAVATATFGARFGTGTAPANGVAVTGTAWGSHADFTVQPPAAAAKIPFTFTDIVTLTPGTAAWFDLALQTSVAADHAAISNVSLTAVEL